MTDARRKLSESLEAGAGARVASSLSRKGAATVNTRVAKARRTRTAWQAGVAAAAVVAIGGAAAAWAGPSRDSGPAAPSPTSSATRVVSSMDDAPVEDVAALADTSWVCGAAWTLDAGVSVTAETARDAGQVSAELVDGGGQAGVTAIGDGETSDALWSVTVAGHGADLVSVTTRSIVTLGDRIVGVSDMDESLVVGGPASGTGTYVDLDTEGVESLVPYPGDCGRSTYLWDDGAYDVHLVVQLTMADGSVAQVVDPAGSPSVEFSGMLDRLELLAEPSEADPLTPPAEWSEPVETVTVDASTTAADAVLRVEGQPGFVCGEEWDLEAGAYLNDTSYGGDGASIVAAPIVIPEEEYLAEEGDISTLLKWQFTVTTSEDDGTDTWAQAVAVRDGVVVGASDVYQAATGVGGDTSVRLGDAYLPRSGWCRSDTAQKWASASDDELARTEIHLIVVQVEMGETYATWVDPGGTVTEADAFAD
ncbi:hypothetical protein [Demequina salsinemoris]|uniref:hypothetical protein n=1 Tax=Demequina salsinemoris TaxID=577470 RepID=UPI000780A501|nr:hypothetical protein [Demequina salsinemoris]